MRRRSTSTSHLLFSACAALALLTCAATASAQLPVVYFDGPIDRTIRRFDGGDAPPGIDNLLLPDLVSHRIGPWQPDDFTGSLFRGDWMDGADFFRLDLVFDGLVNPPGPDFNSLFAFGPNPLLGFVEIDVDDNPDTGGELLGAQFRYQGVAARFGGLPVAPRFAGRIARDACPGTFDADISTGPYFPERSGEEFHLSFLWGQITAIDFGTNGDAIFAPGEAWEMSGHFLHRANGFDDFILLCCSNGLPGYDPEVRVLFRHVPAVDRTTVSLVYPLNHAGAAAVSDGVAEPMDCCADNQSSIAEALEHLMISATFATAADRQNVNFPLLAQWEFQSPVDHLDPTRWRLNGVFAGAFADPAGVGIALAWSDIFPNVMPRDFNGDGTVDPHDRNIFDAFLQSADGGSCDADGAVNGVFEVIGFGNGFNLFDVNYDGVVTVGDRPLLPSVADFDIDSDGDVDLADYAVLQFCVGDSSQPVCATLDVNDDGALDAIDVQVFVQLLNGPGGGP